MLVINALGGVGTTPPLLCASVDNRRREYLCFGWTLLSVGLVASTDSGGYRSNRRRTNHSKWKRMRCPAGNHLRLNAPRAHGAFTRGAFDRLLDEVKAGCFEMAAVG